MARYSGFVGFAHTVRTSPGVSEEVLIERGKYRGDLKRESRSLTNGEHLNSNLSTSNTIEIIADAYASENFVAIRYITWAGALWTVSEVTVQRPRLLLRLGGVYNGKRGTRSEEVGTPGAP